MQGPYSQKFLWWSDVGAYEESLNASAVCESSVEEVAADLGPHLFR